MVILIFVAASTAGTSTRCGAPTSFRRTVVAPPPSIEIWTSLTRRLPRYNWREALSPFVRISDVTREGGNVTSIHSPFSAPLPSCQLVFGSPSIPLGGWYFDRPSAHRD